MLFKVNRIIEKEESMVWKEACSISILTIYPPLQCFLIGFQLVHEDLAEIEIPYLPR